MQRIAIVTGGARGMGTAISKALHSADYQVIALYHSHEETARKFTEETGVTVLKCDVSDFNACHQAVSHIEQEFGGVSILVNNAGITRDSVLHKMTLEQWMAVIQTNLTSCFNMCHAVINGMRERSFGRIINISSVNAQRGQRGQTNYSAAKAGILGFTKALALESANKGITVNSIAPGYIDTEMVRAVPDAILEKIIEQVPVGRLGTPEEIARTVLFLAGEEAGFITGSTLSINGGLYNT